MSYSFSGISAATYGNVSTAGTGGELIMYRTDTDGNLYSTILSGGSESMIIKDDGETILTPITLNTGGNLLVTESGDNLATESSDLLEV